MTPVLAKAKVTLRYSTRPDGDVEYSLETTIPGGLSTNWKPGGTVSRRSMIESVISALRMYSPKSELHVVVGGVTQQISQRTVEQIFNREIEAEDLLI
jgi:hypothetical protein